MDIEVNGQASDVPTGSTLGWLLTDMDLSAETVAVAKNGEVVPRSEVPYCVLKPDDRIEIVRAVGGG